MTRRAVKHVTDEMANPRGPEVLTSLGGEVIGGLRAVTRQVHEAALGIAYRIFTEKMEILERRRNLAARSVCRRARTLGRSDKM